MDPNMMAQLQALIQGGQGGQMPGRPGPGQVPGQGGQGQDPRLQAMQQMMPTQSGPQQPMPQRPIPAQPRPMSELGAGFDPGDSTEQDMKGVQDEINRRAKGGETLGEAQGRGPQDRDALAPFTGNPDKDRQILLDDPTDGNIAAFMELYGEEELPDEMQDPDNADAPDYATPGREKKVK